MWLIILIVYIVVVTLGAFYLLLRGNRYKRWYEERCDKLIDVRYDNDLKRDEIKNLRSERNELQSNIRNYIHIISDNCVEYYVTIDYRVLPYNPLVIGDGGKIVKSKPHDGIYFAESFTDCHNYVDNIAKRLKAGGGVR